jgi:hypothetical protein
MGRDSTSIFIVFLLNKICAPMRANDADQKPNKRMGVEAFPFTGDQGQPVFAANARLKP